MLIKSPDQVPRGVPDRPGERLSLPRTALIVLAALLIAPAAWLTSSANATQPTSPRSACVEVSPGPANLLGAMEGQPPIPGQGVWVARSPAGGGCPRH
ncbi:MAG: hypothetical protein QOE32_1126 [Pseudonocardiales bacterium]|nr:hypothetical protein [Pseudonocardiales bacterium]